MLLAPSRMHDARRVAHLARCSSSCSVLSSLSPLATTVRDRRESASAAAAACARPDTGCDCDGALHAGARERVSRVESVRQQSESSHQTAAARSRGRDAACSHRCEPRRARRAYKTAHGVRKGEQSSHWDWDLAPLRGCDSACPHRLGRQAQLGGYGRVNQSGGGGSVDVKKWVSDENDNAVS